MGNKRNIFQRFADGLRGIIVGPASSLGSFVNPNNINFGVTVNTDAALRFTAVYAAIKILAENIAALPKSVKKKTADGCEDAYDHDVYQLLCVQPNKYTDIFTFWFTMISNLEGKGNAYAIIERKAGRPVALHQVGNDFVSVSFVNGEKIFVVKHPDPDFSFLNGTYLDQDFIHIMLFSRDGLKGIDPITYNAASIGRGIATQKFSADFYQRGGQIKGTLETDGALDDDTYENFMRHYNSSAQNFETPLLEYGIKYKSIGITPIAAQLIQSETLSIQDIARIFSIPPHLLAEMSHATFSNIEQQNIFFGAYSLRPICKRIEQQLEAKLFMSTERGRYSIKFDLKGMMRGDDAARSAYYRSGIEAGWMTPNEARGYEGLKKLPGLDNPRMPLNTGYVNEAGDIVNPNATTNNENNE